MSGGSSHALSYLVLFWADQKVQDSAQHFATEDLYNITKDFAAYATALPPPLNVIGLIWQLCGFAMRHERIKNHWPEASVWDLFSLYLSRNSNKLPPDNEKVLVAHALPESIMFLEDSRKAYMEEVHQAGDSRVQNLVSHMHETVMQVLGSNGANIEDKIQKIQDNIEDRIQKIQDKLERCFPSFKAGVADQTEDVGSEYTVCGYLTDVEGNFDYFERYVSISQIVGWSDEDSSFVPKHKKLEFKRDDAVFVYGGDTQDKGIGDIRFTKLLLELRENYPGRVEFIIGNRDANKMRLATELHEDAIKDPKVLNDRSFPYWENEHNRCTPQMWLEKNPPENGGSVNNGANRLRWILETNMGAFGAFERRRHELSILRECGKADISDEHVVQSYRDEVDPRKIPGLQWEEVGSEKPMSGKMFVGQGSAELAARLEKGLLELSPEEYKELGLAWDLSYNSYIHVGGKYFKPRRKDGNNYMLQFLKNAKLAHVFGPNLFVHGALSADNQGTVPGATEPKGKVLEWVDALNAWAQAEVKAFEEGPYSHAQSTPNFNGLYTNRKGGALMDYGVTNGNAECACVCVLYECVYVNLTFDRTCAVLLECLLVPQTTSVVVRRVLDNVGCCA
jgi:ElaB/YqjD/DUF883 family membrane-anchored ribosome-binding protein